MKKEIMRKTLIALIAIVFAAAGAGWTGPGVAFADDTDEPAYNEIPAVSDEQPADISDEQPAAISDEQIQGATEDEILVPPGKGTVQLHEQDANGGDSSGDPPIVLNVCIDSKSNVVKGFTVAELEEIWANEGGKVYTYSALNTYPTSKLAIGAGGPTVQGTIEAAGINTADITGNQIIEMIGTDSVGQKFLKSKLFAKRYYFPNGKAEQNRNGKAPLASSWNGKVVVPAIISLSASTDNEENCEKRLLFGQVSPNEQTWQASIQYLIGNGTKTGTIIVHTQQAGKFNAIATTNKGKGGAFLKNTILEFDRSVNGSANSLDGRYIVYFTTDGTTPDPASATSQMYNYNNINFGTSAEKINKPVISKDGVMTIKTKVVGYGKQDSGVSTFKFTGVTLPAKAAGLKTTRLSYQGLKVSWSRVTGATGYEVSRSTSKTTGFKTVRKITSGSTCTFSDSKGLKTGTAYYYKVRALKTVSGKTFYGSWSALTTGKPVLGKTSITKLKSKKKKITITWTKVAGASGYQIYQAKKSKGSYKLVKTITSQSTDTWKTKKLKKKKKYWYKVRAYRIVGGKKVYSSFSAVKYKKVK